MIWWWNCGNRFALTVGKRLFSPLSWDIRFKVLYWSTFSGNNQTSIFKILCSRMSLASETVVLSLRLQDMLLYHQKIFLLFVIWRELVLNPFTVIDTSLIFEALCKCLAVLGEKPLIRWETVIKKIQIIETCVKSWILDNWYILIFWEKYLLGTGV